MIIFLSTNAMEKHMIHALFRTGSKEALKWMNTVRGAQSSTKPFQAKWLGGLKMELTMNWFTSKLCNRFIFSWPMFARFATDLPVVWKVNERSSFRLRSVNLNLWQTSGVLIRFKNMMQISPCVEEEELFALMIDHLPKSKEKQELEKEMRMEKKGHRF